MKSARLHGFIVAVVAAGAVAGVLQDWSAFVLFPTEDFFGLAILGLLALFSEALSLSLDVGKSSGSDSVSTSISFIPVFVALLIFGPAAALLLMLTAGVFAELAIRRKPAIKVLFNTGQWALACGLGGLVFTALGGTTLSGTIGEGGQVTCAPRRELFLERMEALIPWEVWRRGFGRCIRRRVWGRQPYPLAANVLRIHCVSSCSEPERPGDGGHAVRVGCGGSRGCV